MFPLKNSFLNRIIHALYQHAFWLYDPLYYFYKQTAEKKAIRFFRQKIKRGMCVLDIGANIGFYTRLFSSLVGETGRVIAFEPERLNFAYLQRSTRQLGNVECYAYAVGAESGRTFLYLSEDMNVDHHAYQTGEDRSKVEVPGISIDHFTEPTQTIDFVKVDVQGYEFAVFQGMKNLLEQSQNMMIYSEIYPFGLKYNGVSPRELISFLEQTGYKVDLLGREISLFDEKVDDPHFYSDFYAEKTC